LPVYRGLGRSVLDIARAAGLDFQLIDGAIINIVGFEGLPKPLRDTLQLHCLLAAKSIAPILRAEEAAQ
jgi:hypothetical protein